jgi:hypothetical protein
LACKRCGSVAQQEFGGELSASFPYVKESSLQPVYICQHVFICLDCGFAELRIPSPELETLRKGWRDLFFSTANRLPSIGADSPLDQEPTEEHTSR